MAFAKWAITLKLLTGYIGATKGNYPTLNPLDLVLAFIEGFALIISPCILPVLPIILSVGVEGGQKRPYGIILGFITAFWAFTLLSRKLVLLLGIDTEIIRQLSFYFLLLFGLVLLSEFLSEKFSLFAQKLADWGLSLTSPAGNRPDENKEGFFSGFIVGIFIGLVWSPCVGPIVAAVLVQSIRQTTDFNSALLLGAFSIGVGVPMLLITLGGKKIMAKLNVFKTHTKLVRKILGIIIILTVLLTGGSSLFQFSSASVEPSKPVAAAPKLTGALQNPYPAQDFKGISAWINSPPLTISQLKGKVVLVDFWTYSCINCVRTLPHITQWYQKYRSQGLVIVGVHSPEFEFEKKLSNVQMAVKQHHIQYPVALDNKLDTFVNFNNRYWPAHYLIDRSGKVVYTHFGEGHYDVTENNIRALLGVSGKANLKKAEVLGSANQTPETYLGYTRTENFKSPQGQQRNKTVVYAFPAALPLNGWALNGKWQMGGDQVTAMEKGAALKLHFYAKKVFLVLGANGEKPVSAQLYLNGKPLTTFAGKNVKNGQLLIGQHTLYELVNQNQAKGGLLEIKANGPGLSAYAFTFG